MDHIYLYGPIYSGVKLTFNSKKQRGKTVQGIAVDVDYQQNTVILRDKENFAHCVDATYIDIIDSTKKGIKPNLIK